MTNATPGGRGKNHKAPAPTIAPNVPREQQGTPFQGGGQNSAPRNLSKHAQGSHHSTGRVNNQGTVLPSNGSTPKPQKHVDQDRSSPPQSNNAPHSSNGQKHQQKHAPQSQPSHAKQSKSSQPPPAAAHHEEHSQRSSASAQQNNAPQPSNGSHGKGKGKGGGKNKTNEEKNHDHS